MQPCYVYDARAERDRIAELPEVEAAARGPFRGVTVAKASTPADTTAASTLVTLDPGIGNSLAGRHQVVEGRSAQRSDEILLNEVLAARASLAVGDEVVLTWRRRSSAKFRGGRGHLPRTVRGGHHRRHRSRRSRPQRAQEDVPANEAAVVYGGSGLDAATVGAGGFSAVLVEATDDDSEAATGAIEAAFPTGNFNLASALEVDEVEPTRVPFVVTTSSERALGGGASTTGNLRHTPFCRGPCRAQAFRGAFRRKGAKE